MKDVNKGIFYNQRAKNKKFSNGNVNREYIISRLWNKENAPDGLINYGNGIAQDLMIVHENEKEHLNHSDGDNKAYGRSISDGEKLVLIYHLSKREQKIISTVIQWFGSNCGFDFIRQFAEQCGYELKKKITPNKRSQNEQKTVKRT